MQEAKAFNALVDDNLAEAPTIAGSWFETQNLHVKANVGKLKNDMRLSTREAWFGNAQAQPIRAPTIQLPPQARSIMPRPPLSPAQHTHRTCCQAVPMLGTHMLHGLASLSF